MESLNRMATELIDEALGFADELSIDSYELPNEATVLDFGVETLGGIESGLLLAEIQTGGLATLSSSLGEIDGKPRQFVDLTTDHPALSLLCSQKAGWELAVSGGDLDSSDRYEGLGSGPARALVAEEEEYRQIGYADAFDFGILTIESDRLPTAAVAKQIAERCEIPPESVFLPTYPTASITGSVTMAARAAELAVFRAFELGIDPLDILSVSGRAPVGPVGENEATAIARTNDALAYGGQVHLIVDREGEEDMDLFAEVPSSAGGEYGVPFTDIFESVDWEFGNLSQELFAPAQITVDVVGGSTRTYGSVNEELLIDSFEGGPTEIHHGG